MKKDHQYFWGLFGDLFRLAFFFTNVLAFSASWEEDQHWSYTEIKEFRQKELGITPELSKSLNGASLPRVLTAGWLLWCGPAAVRPVAVPQPQHLGTLGTIAKEA